MSNNQAQEHINKAALFMANFQALIEAANSVLKYSKTEFEAANAASLTKKCPTRQQLEDNLRHHYQTLFQQLEAIATELQKPTLQRMVGSVPQDDWKTFSRSIDCPIDGKSEETLTLSELCRKIPNMAGLAYSLKECEQLEVKIQDCSDPGALTIKSEWEPYYNE